ncbi:Villin-1 [Zea mays]|uniref:Villin-1 n=1 Tax=Zea mays TaxID=4577 RepID=A0A1D6LY94_MAIZE|nr:Villin-1 [Zea mays]
MLCNCSTFCMLHNLCVYLQDDRMAATSLMSSMVDSVKGHPVVAQVFEGGEPELFLSVFKSLIIFKGGRSAAYKSSVLQKSPRNGCHESEGVALFRVQGLKHYCVQAIQVDLVASSLNSSHCYILQDNGLFLTWLGGLSSPSDHNILDMIMSKLCPMEQSLLVREGSEPDHFWKALGGRSEYSKEKRVKGWPADPHLYACRFEQGLLKVKEVFSFCKDDLATEETLILDCNEEIYVWVGLHSDITSKEQALNVGKMFLKDAVHGGRSMETTVYAVTEGDEPGFFTSFFDWDNSKQSYMVGNSFERKLAVLKGVSPKLETPDRSLRRPSRRPGVSSEPTTPEHQQPTARRAFGSTSAGRFARERSPAVAPPTLSPSPKSRSSSSTPTTVARRLFPASVHASEAVHVVSTATARRR